MDDRHHDMQRLVFHGHVCWRMRRLGGKPHPDVCREECWYLIGWATVLKRDVSGHRQLVQGVNVTELTAAAFLDA